jgi:hypothetical protein
MKTINIAPPFYHRGCLEARKDQNNSKTLETFPVSAPSRPSGSIQSDMGLSASINQHEPPWLLISSVSFSHNCTTHHLSSGLLPYQPTRLLHSTHSQNIFQEWRFDILPYIQTSMNKLISRVSATHTKNASARLGSKSRSHCQRMDHSQAETGPADAYGTLRIRVSATSSNYHSPAPTFP